MVKACSTFSTKNKSQKGSGVSFHSFPHQNSELLNKWIIDSKRKNFESSTWSKLCNEHFSEDSYQLQRNASYLFVKSNAFPMRFDFPKDLNTPLPKKRRAIVNHELSVQDYTHMTSEELQQEKKNAKEILSPLPSTSFSVVQDYDCREPTMESVLKPTSSEILPSLTNLHLCHQLKVLRQQLKRRDKKIYSMKNLICTLETKILLDVPEM